MKTKKKLHLINSLVLALLTTWFILCIYIIFKYNISEWAQVWVEYLWWLLLFFALFWIFMKYWDFFIEEEKKLLKNKSDNDEK